MFSQIIIALLLSVFCVPLAVCQTSRPFAMASTAIQAVPGDGALYKNHSAAFSFQTLAQDADIVSVFPEYLGVPFDLFAVAANPPAGHPWTVQMTALARAAKAAGKPIMLQTVLARDVVVAKASANGTALQIEAGWAPRCADFAAAQYAHVTPAYLNYVSWMAKTFAPRYFVIMIEANLYYVHCGGNTPSWRKLVAIERSAYDTVKFQNPSMIVFPSFKLEDLYGQTLMGYDQAQFTAMASLKRDRLGLATYPYGMQLSPSNFANPYQLPPDYLTRLRDKNPTQPKIVITETGWNSEPISIFADACYHNFLYSAASYASAYLSFLLQSAHIGQFDAVTWWSGRDLIPANVMTTCYPLGTPPSYPACNGEKWCKAVNLAKAAPTGGATAAFAELAFKAFGTMGLRRYDGTPKAGLHNTWRRFLALPRQ